MYIRNGMKKLPITEKMAKAIEMRKLQQRMTALSTQQQQHEDKVEELQDNVERVMGIIQLVESEGVRC